MTERPADRQLHMKENHRPKEKDKNSRALRKRFRYNAAL